MKGKYVYYNKVKHYGNLIGDDGTKFIFFAGDVDIDFVLVPFESDEPVEFDHDEKNMTAKTKAINIRRVNWKKGKVKTFDMGWGFITEETTGKDYFVHHSDINPPGPKIKRLIVGEEVVFKIGKDKEGKDRAICCSQLDRRPLFNRYFDFSSLPGEYNAAITKLAEMSSKEDDPDWNYTHEQSPYPNPVLYNYLQHTLLRLIRQHNDSAMDSNVQQVQFDNDHNTYILEVTHGRNQKYLFNTGLADEYGDDIFALFEDDQQKQSKWSFVGFFTHSNTILVNIFGDRRPHIATYLDNPIDFIFDSRLKIIPDKTHILDHNFDRLPTDIQGKTKKELGELLERRTEDAARKVKRNYRIAVPQFYDGHVQLLLPLCLSTPQKVDLALAVERRTDSSGLYFYYGNTVLSLSMAYNNARLISPLDRWGWLLP